MQVRVLYHADLGFYKEKGQPRQGKGLLSQQPRAGVEGAIDSDINCSIIINFSNFYKYYNL